MQQNKQYISSSHVVIVLFLLSTIGTVVYLPSYHTIYFLKKEDVTLKMYKEHLSIIIQKENSHEGNHGNNQAISQFLFQPVAINSASKEKLMTIRGIGDKLSTQIIEYRNQQPFTCLEDLSRLAGISKKRAKKFRKEFSFTIGKDKNRP